MSFSKGGTAWLPVYPADPGLWMFFHCASSEFTREADALTSLGLFIYKVSTCNTVAMRRANYQRYANWNFTDEIKKVKIKRVPVFSSRPRLDGGAGPGHTPSLWLPWCEPMSKSRPRPGPWAACAGLTHPDAVHDGSGFALRGLWVPDEVVPGAEHPPAEGVVFAGGAGEAGAGVPGHPAKQDHGGPCEGHGCRLTWRAVCGNRSSTWFRPTSAPSGQLGMATGG